MRLAERLDTRWAVRFPRLRFIVTPTTGLNHIDVEAFAQRGVEIDLAAPGVGLLAATSIRGARGKSGTSYAVPFVTAAAALILSREPGLGAAAVAERLKAGARDLGAEGVDEVFGAGLLDVTGLCDAPIQPQEG